MAEYIYPTRSNFGDERLNDMLNSWENLACDIFASHGEIFMFIQF